MCGGTLRRGGRDYCIADPPPAGAAVAGGRRLTGPYMPSKDGKKKGRDTPRGTKAGGPSRETAEAKAAKPGTVRLGSKTSQIVLALLRQLEEEKEARQKRLADGGVVPSGSGGGGQAPEPEPESGSEWQVIEAGAADSLGADPGVTRKALRGKERLDEKVREQWLRERAKEARAEEREREKNQKLLRKLTKADKTAETDAASAADKKAAAAKHFLAPGAKPSKKQVRLSVALDINPRDAKLVLPAVGGAVIQITQRIIIPTEWPGRKSNRIRL